MPQADKNDVQAALKEANKILEEEQMIVLPERDADTVFSLLENPPAPNLRLQEATMRHKAFFRAKEEAGKAY